MVVCSALGLPWLLLSQLEKCKLQSQGEGLLVISLQKDPNIGLCQADFPPQQLNQLLIFNLQENDNEAEEATASAAGKNVFCKATASLVSQTWNDAEAGV